MTDPTKAPVDYLNMSDEDMMNLSAPTEVEANEAQEESQEAGGVDSQTATDPVVEDAGDTDVTKGAEDTGTVAEAAEGADGEAAEQTGEETTSTVAPETVEKTEEKPAEPEAPKAIDYEAEYKRLMAPFKANGREIAPGSPEDAVALMQMGANYNKKMAALKPHLKMLKLLESNGLLTEEKISFLIELEKKSPDAINKLVKDSGLNPMDLDPDKASEYQPKIHTVDDREMALDTVLDEIQDTPTYNRTLKIVSKEWDGESKQVIAQSPELLKVINDHVDRGIYDLINAEVERERVFGRLNGLSDIEAYRQVGDAIQARGGFNHLGSSQGKTEIAKPVVVVPKPKKVDDEKLNEKRRAAGSTKPATPVSAPIKEFNPLALSDAEFAKLTDNRLR